tara:strand:+ start:1796 stop:2017 length:222 start_codon:yes stop_codon:yes gene_type:complete
MVAQFLPYTVPRLMKYESGADIRVLPVLPWHMNISTTKVYTKVTIKHLREVYAKMYPLGMLECWRVLDIILVG